ncbi:hypothetical protein IMSHALPRED_001132 [Imshaugia aleurites]|uniref:Uncharacterized protein n=1 Tax=Imshaugia aleurites TaxID=172621 RepID=A0A8H3J1C8_9LECA|nr:hypothetical protein IMSHALPRED_001132 [Imshaugia aleurites]
MGRSIPPRATATFNLSQATSLFLAKHKSCHIALKNSLKAESAALDARLQHLIGLGPPLDVEFDWRNSKVASTEEAAKKLDGILKDFDREVGKAEERKEVEKEITGKMKEIEWMKSVIQGFKDTIARYEARDG